MRELPSNLPFPTGITGLATRQRRGEEPRISASAGTLALYLAPDLAPNISPPTLLLNGSKL